MAGSTTISPEDILSEICHIFEEVPKETLTAVSDEWITQLEWITEHKGENSHMA
jgi:hypothetical protein